MPSTVPADGATAHSALAALELFKHNNLVNNPLARSIINNIAYLDNNFNARNWDLKVVGLVSFLVLATIRFVFRKRGNVDWYAFLHALTTGVGSLVVVYLNYSVGRLFETERTCAECHTALTSLHRFLPAITLGYSFLDLYEGIHMSPAFALHGIATFSVMLLFCVIKNGAYTHILSPMLTMEVSTIFLTLVHADFLTSANAGSLMMQVLFSTSFFFFRIILVPLIWSSLVYNLFTLQKDTIASDKNEPCFPIYFPYICLVFGLLFNSLNAYWFVKIVKKLHRKFTGKEAIKAKNNLSDSYTTEHTDNTLKSVRNSIKSSIKKDQRRSINRQIGETFDEDSSAELDYADGQLPKDLAKKLEDIKQKLKDN